MKKLILAPAITLSFAVGGFALDERDYEVDDKARVSNSSESRIDIGEQEKKLNSFKEQKAPANDNIFNKNRAKDNSKDSDDDEDENPNLANLSQPAPNIKRNLSMPTDEEQRMSRQMQLDGAQGGIQNTGPRGIGNPSQY